METIGVTLEQGKKIILRYGFIGAGMYIIYFLIMMLFDLEVYTELRFLNYFLFFIAGYYALKGLRAAGEGKMKYLQGLGICFATGALSFIILGIFIFSYCLINPSFLNNVSEHYPYQFIMGPFSALFLVSSEGIAMSSVISLCLMQYFNIFTGSRKWYWFQRRRTNTIKE